MTRADCALTKFWVELRRNTGEHDCLGPCCGREKQQQHDGQQQIPEANALVWPCMVGNNNGFPGESMLRTTFFDVHIVPHASVQPAR